MDALSIGFSTTLRTNEGHSFKVALLYTIIFFTDINLPTIEC